MIVQSNGAYFNNLWDLAGELLPAMEQTLWDLQPLPVNPGNLTAFQGTYIASVLLGYHRLLLPSIWLISTPAS